MVESCKVLFISNPSTVQIDLRLGGFFFAILEPSIQEYVVHTVYSFPVLVRATRRQLGNNKAQIKIHQYGFCLA